MVVTIAMIFVIIAGCITLKSVHNTRKAHASIKESLASIDASFTEIDRLQKESRKNQGM